MRNQTAAILIAMLAAGRLTAAELPVKGTAAEPVVWLALGEVPAEAPEAGVMVCTGRVVTSEGADYAQARKDGVVLARKGYANTRVTLAWAVGPGVRAGVYSFAANFMLGGLNGQSFVVRAGPDAEHLDERAKLSLANKSAWKKAWVKSDVLLSLREGDAVIEIASSGGASDSKVFDSFLLAPVFIAPAGMSAASAEVRADFVKSLKKGPRNPKARLFVLDGVDGGAGDVLFRGLVTKDARNRMASLDASFVSGEKSAGLAKRIGLAKLPAVIVADDSFTFVGAITDAAKEDDVEKFLRDPSSATTQLHRVAVPQPKPEAFRDGSPAAWLAGGLCDGRAGLSIYGVDSEAILRPSPGQPYLESRMMGGSMRAWDHAPADENGRCVLLAAAPHSYSWPRGSISAVAYVFAEKDTDAEFHLKHNGIQSALWLDGTRVELRGDAKPPEKFAAFDPVALRPAGSSGHYDPLESPRVASLHLKSGWHRLLVKFVMQNDEREPFAFVSKFTDADGGAVTTLSSQTSDPDANLALLEDGARLRPAIQVEAPGNLPRPGEPLKIRADVRWHRMGEEPKLDAPILPFAGKLVLTMTDYDGREIARREIEGKFPSEVQTDFGSAPEPGYYEIRPALLDADGKLIMAFPADGFSVVRGAVAQHGRLAKKKLWNNYYYITEVWTDLLPWLERSGIWRNLGSYPTFGSDQKAFWDAARKRGTVLFGDFVADSHDVNKTEAQIAKLAGELAPYTKFFKGFNEIDIHMTMPQREPGTWVERTRWEYEAVKKARPDAIYLGGSLVRPGGAESGAWFEQCLRLGVDRYQDAWDVHSYPQVSPVLEGALTGWSQELDLGVLATYKKVGRENHLPFWLGECGAKAAHSFDGRRGQAEMAAKMVAWANSRPDYHGIAFCLAHEYVWTSGRFWDYQMGHFPGEAALYTVGALVDGLPYRRAGLADRQVQAGWFGDTLMVWTTGKDSDLEWKLDGPGPWLLVDVVGRTNPLSVADGIAKFRVGSSPHYLLTQSRYDELTRVGTP